jgi:hypothetical protein
MQRIAFTDGAELKINTTRRDTLDGAINYALLPASLHARYRVQRHLQLLNIYWS